MEKQVKKTMVELEVGKTKKEFEISHAERILSMPRNGGWKLPEGSKYELKDNGLTLIDNKAAAKKS